MVLSTKSSSTRSRMKYHRRAARFRRRTKKYGRLRLRGAITGDIHSFKLRAVNTFSSSGAGANFDYYTDSNPGAYYNNGTALNDLSNVAALFEQYKIYAVKLKFYPYLSNASTGQYVPLYVIYDPDDSTALTTVNDALKYDNVKVFDVSRPWTYYKKVAASNTAVGGADVSMGAGWHDLAAAVSIGSIKFASTGMFATVNYGTIVATYYMQFAVRR